MTKGCTKAGKGAWTAIAICLWWYLYDPCKIVIVGPKFEHVKSLSMFPEIKKFMRQMTDQRETVINSESINWPDSEDKFIQIGNADSDEAFSGIHGPNTLAVFDESSKIRAPLFHQAQTQARMIIALSNPRYATGWFRECFPTVNPDETQDYKLPAGKRRLITVSGRDCANVKSGFEVIPSQITREILANVMDPRGKEAWFPDCMGLGKFPTEDTETMLFAPSWIERAENAFIDLRDKQRKPLAFGLDVGASKDGDPSCLASADKYGIIDIHTIQKSDTMQLVGWVMAFIKNRYGIDLTNGLTPIEVDVIGVGQGAFDRLRERGVKTLPSNVRRKSKIFRDSYANWRTERYGELSRRLRPDGDWPDSPFALPYDAELRDELVAHEKFHNSAGRFMVTPKKKKPGDKSNFQGQTIYEKLGRSPNKSDAVVYAYSALSTVFRGLAPRVNRPLNVGTSHDTEEPRKMRPKAEDLPPPQLSSLEIEPVEVIAFRVAKSMDFDDERDGFNWR